MTEMMPTSSGKQGAETVSIANPAGLNVSGGVYTELKFFTFCISNCTSGGTREVGYKVAKKASESQTLLKCGAFARRY